MPSDSGDYRRATKPNNQVSAGGAPPPETEHLPCPRCDSTNTKFCYYNNYNFSQPRHFCKSCRRYWTHGGTLRDIPVGGGSRKNAKRCRTTAPSSASGTPIFVPFSADQLQFSGDVKPSLGMCGSFTSLLNTQGTGLFGFGLEELGFGLGRGVWAFNGVGDGGAGGGSVVGNTWQLESGEGGFVGGGDCFTLPDLAISTPGYSMK